jgi:hypothetical protein
VNTATMPCGTGYHWMDCLDDLDEWYSRMGPRGCVPRKAFGGGMKVFPLGFVPGKGRIALVLRIPVDRVFVSVSPWRGAKTRGLAGFRGMVRRSYSPIGAGANFGSHTHPPIPASSHPSPTRHQTSLRHSSWNRSDRWTWRIDWVERVNCWVDGVGPVKMTFGIDSQAGYTPWAMATEILPL